MRKIIKRHSKIFSSLVIIGLAAVLFIGYQCYQKAGQTSIEKNIMIEVVNDNEAYMNTYEIKTKSITLGEALDELAIAQYEDNPMSRYIISLDGMKADEIKQEWWGFYINGEFSQMGIDDTNIVDGDKYTFVFNVGYQ